MRKKEMWIAAGCAVLSVAAAAGVAVYLVFSELLYGGRLGISGGCSTVYGDCWEEEASPGVPCDTDSTAPYERCGRIPDSLGYGPHNGSKDE